MKQMVKKNGIRRGLYQGFITTQGREIPAFGAYWSTYEWTKYKFAPENPAPDYTPPVPVMLAAGATAGMMTWFISYPFDVMKSVVQTRPDNCPKEHLTMRYVVREGLQQYGWRFFTRGLGTCLVYAVPVNATTFFIYEEVQKQLAKYDSNFPASA